MSSPIHVHLVDGDAPAREALRQYLTANGLVVTPMGSAEELLRRLPALRPDLIVLDMLLPGISGLRACQQLRGAGDRVPLVFVSSRAEEVDRVLGLEMGADDVLAKPASAREVLARIHAVLRRALVPPGQPQWHRPAVTIGGQRFDPAARCLQREGRQHMLSTVEFAVLAELVANPGIAVSRERLRAVSHSRDEALQLRAVDVVVMRLRKRIEPDPALPRYIQTLRGHGYMFVPDSPDQRSRRNTPSGVAASPSMNSV